jgi:DNA-binding XRE family transcriptional regulator
MGVCNKVKTAQGLFSQSAILPMKKRFTKNETSTCQRCEFVKSCGMNKPEKPPSFADELKTERLRAGLTQTDCARLLDVSLHTICKWEKGASALSLTQEAALGRLRAAKPAVPSLQQQLSAMPRAKLERLAASLVKGENKK